MEFFCEILLKLGLQRQCLNRRFPDEDFLRREVSVWAADRNMQKKGIEWSFTKEKAAAKFKLPKFPTL